MYEERKEKFSFKSFFLILLLLLLFAFLMLWLFPTKSYVNDKLQSSYDLEKLSIVYDEVFANNVSKMKDAGVGYFTTERLPGEVGESKKLTLQEMYNLHLVLKLKGKDGKLCDASKSYIEMTKYVEEYRMKVYLSCGTQADYITVYLGCYNYCKDGVCEKQAGQSTKAVVQQNVNNNPEQNTNQQVSYKCKVYDGKYYDLNGNVVTKSEYDYSCGTTTMYQYKLVKSDEKVCNTNWSEWQLVPIQETKTLQVQTKVEQVFNGWKVVNQAQTVKKQVTEKYISKYVTQTVLTGTKDVQVGTTTQTVTDKVVVGSVEKATGKIGTGSKVPQNTDKIHYKVISTDTNNSCSYCENKTMYTWEEYSVEPVYDVVTTTKEVPVYKTINVYETKEVPVYDFRTVEKEVPVNGTTEQKTVADYKDATYYRSRACTYISGGVSYEWSTSRYDQNLINRGYVFTGKTNK